MAGRKECRGYGRRAGFGSKPTADWQPVRCCDTNRGTSIVTTEKQKMLAGEMYDAADAELTADRRRARDLCQRLNTLPGADQIQRDRIIRELLGRIGDEIIIESPFHCD